MSDNDKARDDKFFNCSEEHEFTYVSGRYGSNKATVYNFLKTKCRDGVIKYMTHREVYELIRKELGYPIP